MQASSELLWREGRREGGKRREGCEFERMRPRGEEGGFGGGGGRGGGGTTEEQMTA